MLVSEIIQSSFPVLHYTDSVETAIELLQQNNIEHLAVINNDTYEGLLSMDELLSAENTDNISMLSDKFMHISIINTQHFLTALKLITEFGITALPVLTNNGEYLGIVTEKILVQCLGSFLSTDVPGGIFVLEMQKQKFSIGEICRLVETNDAFVTQINTYTEQLSGLLIVTFKINKTEISDILATLQRYDYTIRHYFGEEFYENGLKENFENLMAYLNV
ncbi:MAG: CBS domain-containing protein [Parafilimonas sp.]